MNINPLHNSAAIQKAYGAQPTAKPAAAAPAAPTRGSDKLELSSNTVDHLMGQLKTNDVRWSKVNDIKAQIANGTYETDDKLESAADKLLDDVI